MHTKNKLELFLASHAAARFACENWHYSKCVPGSKIFKVGVNEGGKFIGVVLFSRGANANMGKHFGMDTTEVIELSRVALTKHETPVSRILKIAVKIMSKHNPGVKLVFSYADETNQGHTGGIYRADNWMYLGKRTTIGGHYYLNGKFTHRRSISSRWGSVKKIPKTITVEPVTTPQVKHLFVKCLCESSKESVARRFHLREGGANPTDLL